MTPESLDVLLVTGPGSDDRNGSGCNPIALFQGDVPPSLGAMWDPFVEFDEAPAPFGGDVLFNFVGVSTRPLGVDSFASLGDPCNELLISVAPNDLIFVQSVLPGQSFQIPISSEPGAVGTICYTQGGDVATDGSIRLTNALDATIGF